jgi:hypothetical protein
VASADFVRPTGVADYDRKILDRVKQWKFEPVSDGTAPARVCSHAPFAFRVRPGDIKIDVR